MYVCICNALKEKDVRTAIQNGANSIGHVFKAQGCKPDCAQCFNCMRDVINDEINSFAKTCAAK